MNKCIVIPAVLLCFASVNGAITDKRYYLQGGELTVKTISLPGRATTVKHTSINSNLSGLQILDTVVQYQILASYQGSGTAQRNPMSFFTRQPGTSSFQKSTIDSFSYVRIFSSKSVGINGLTCDYWFSFINKAVDTVGFAIISRPDSTKLFQTWFAYAQLQDTIYDINIGTSQASLSHIRYYPSWSFDSSALDNMLSNGWTDETSYNGTTKKGVITIQLFKAFYDTIVPTTGTSHNAIQNASPRRVAISIHAGSKTIQTGVSWKGPLPDHMSICAISGATVGSATRSGHMYVLNSNAESLSKGCYILKVSNQAAGSFLIR